MRGGIKVADEKNVRLTIGQAARVLGMLDIMERILFKMKIDKHTRNEDMVHLLWDNTQKAYGILRSTIDTLMNLEEEEGEEEDAEAE